MESKPLHDYECLKEWKPMPKYSYLSSSLTTWQRNFKKRLEAAEVLVCHDMKGGYLADRWRLGSREADDYKFWHWWNIDIFVYFSHHFVTIPPTSWVDAGHKHGVKVLGTFITEWNHGESLCLEFLKDENSWKMCAKKLIEISLFYKLDGWLLNIENKLEPSMVCRMLSFVKYLTNKHTDEMPGSIVLWYDSVTVNGELIWQNELNNQNLAFFEASSGIFLNYTWDVKNLDTTAENAGNKKENVYVGSDVFGTECHCTDDNQYDTSMMRSVDLGTRKRLDGLDVDCCIEMAHRKGMSAAIFAPGWVYEVLGKENFLKNEKRFWDKLDKFSPGRRIASLPITTSFCYGFGRCYHYMNKVLSNKPWSNMSLQSLQPVHNSSFSCCADASYFGGSCLVVSCLKDIHGRHIPSLYRLFNTDIIFGQKDETADLLCINWCFKCPSNVRVSLLLVMDRPPKDGEPQMSDGWHCLFLCGSGDLPIDEELISRLFHTKLDSVEMNESSGVEDGCLKVNVNRDVQIQEELLWIERSHCISNVSGKNLKGIYLLVEPNNAEADTCEVLLGYLDMSLKEGSHHRMPTILNNSNTAIITLDIIDEKLIEITISFSSGTNEHFHSFSLVRTNSSDESFTEVNTVSLLKDTIRNEGDGRDLFLKWSCNKSGGAGGGRFHVFVQHPPEPTFNFLAATPTSIVSFDTTCVNYLIELGRLKMKIEWFTL